MILATLVATTVPMIVYLFWDSTGSFLMTLLQLI